LKVQRNQVFILTFIIMFLAFAEPVFADVPTVQTIEVTKEAENTILNLQIRHGSPSSNHYVDVIEVEIDERLDQITGLEPQTSTVFIYKHNIGIAQYQNIRARAHCNIHGWSSWTSLESPIPSPTILPTPTGPTPAPTPSPQPAQGIPLEWIAAIVAIVIVVATVVALWIRKK